MGTPINCPSNLYVSPKGNEDKKGGENVLKSPAITMHGTRKRKILQHKTAKIFLKSFKPKTTAYLLGCGNYIFSVAVMEGMKI